MLRSNGFSLEKLPCSGVSYTHVGERHKVEMTIGSHMEDNFDDNNDHCDIKEISAVALVSIVLLTMEDGNEEESREINKIWGQ